MNFKIVVSLYFSEYMEKNLLMELGLYIVIEMVIQVQQVVVIVVIISLIVVSYFYDGNQRRRKNVIYYIRRLDMFIL